MSRLSPIRANQHRRNTRLRCDCMGYWFPHRRRGGACEHSPRRNYYSALRQGATLAQAQAELSAVDLDRLFPITFNLKEGR